MTEERKLKVQLTGVAAYDALTRSRTSPIPTTSPPSPVPPRSRRTFPRDVSESLTSYS